jgi:hypothetical protein
MVARWSANHDSVVHKIGNQLAQPHAITSVGFIRLDDTVKASCSVESGEVGEFASRDIWNAAGPTGVKANLQRCAVAPDDWKFWWQKRERAGARVCVGG